MAVSIITSIAIQDTRFKIVLAIHVDIEKLYHGISVILYTHSLQLSILKYS